jgi:hypothetical protein
MSSRKEAATIMQAAMLKSVTNAVMISTCHLLMLAIVAVLVLCGIPLHAASLFKMMSYFIQLELTLVLFMPFAIQGLAEIAVTLGRIQVQSGVCLKVLRRVSYVLNFVVSIMELVTSLLAYISMDGSQTALNVCCSSLYFPFTYRLALCVKLLNANV